MLPSWQGWHDQGLYLRAAQAWAALNLDPAAHHYPPGYALAAAPFVRIMPADPFLAPDLICSAASLILFVRICRRLAPDWFWCDVAAAGCFVALGGLGHTAASMWAVPWTTTLAAPLLFTMLLMALRYGELGMHRDVALMGAAAGVGAMVRPSDAGLVLLVCTAFCLWRLVAAQQDARTMLRAAASLCAGLAAGLAPAIVAHVTVHGFSAGHYIGQSAALGFDWRLIPLRWVTLAIGPRPLFPTGTGMAAVFPWLLPGVAGMVLAGLPGHTATPANRFIAVTLCVYWLLYLSYRDLHSYGLWRYNNVHYFKWTLPFLAFWALLLTRAMARRADRPAAVAAVALSTLLFCWRPEFVPLAHGEAATEGVRAPVPGGLPTIDSAFLLAADGDWTRLFLGHAHLLVDSSVFVNTADFKVFPVAGGVMLMPLRDLPPGDATIVFPPGTRLPNPAAWTAGRVRVVFGVPCLVIPRSHGCAPVAESQLAHLPLMKELH
jgi:hypothetical protein